MFVFMSSGDRVFAVRAEVRYQERAEESHQADSPQVRAGGEGIGGWRR
jgi:hypothetical protein